MTDTSAAKINSVGSASDTKDLTLLVVEDDRMSVIMLMMCLNTLFKDIIVATDGLEGFRLFSERNPDIVITDQMMPGLSGLELMKKIRETGAKTPVILMTSNIDNEILMKAINMGIEQFIPKPLDFNQITRTLGSISRTITMERLLEAQRHREVEHLRYRDAYHSAQQELSIRKERHVVRHDLRNQVLAGAGDAHWGINVSYAPHDIMCGDGYSVRTLFDGRELIFIADAMGSGMSASLTAMLATSFVNYQVENLHLWHTFTLDIFLLRFKEYLSQMLLDDEVLSCGFFLVDLKNEVIEAALCALPPILLREINGSVRRICGVNAPIGIYTGEIRISTISLSGIADLLVMTDGVTDAPLIGGGAYREELSADFQSAPTLAAFQRRFNSRINHEDLDDMTLLHLRRLHFDSGWHWRGEPELTPGGLSRTIREFLTVLVTETELTASCRDELEVILTEALTNALEHGCLGIDRDEKARLLMNGDFEDALENRVPMPDAGIELDATLWRNAGTPLLIMEVRDTGSGLPLDLLNSDVEEKAVNGRGLKMIRRYCDSVFIGKPGGCLILLKSLERGESQAD
jgi:DNA-binding response OmpR family regulator/anti-sigma regulatory factor (Ser/Thr protein kinase)